MCLFTFIVLLFIFILVKTIIIPAANEKDLHEVDKTVRDSVKFIPVKTGWEVLTHALAEIKQVKNDGSDSYGICTDITKIKPTSGKARVSLKAAE